MTTCEVRSGIHSVHLDYLLPCGKTIAFLSVFERSQQLLKAFCAMVSLNTSGVLHIGETNLKYPVDKNTKFKVYISPVHAGKERYYHAMLVNEEVGKSMFLSSRENIGNAFYNIMMAQYDLPLMEWWGDALLKEAVRTKAVTVMPAAFQCGPYVNVGNRMFFGQKSSDVQICDCSGYSIEQLIKNIKTLFNREELYISHLPQQKIEVANMGDYINKYGHTLVRNLENVIRPLSPFNGEINSFALRNMRLYPQQAAIVNAILNYLRNARYAFLTEGMGVGKTCQTLGICEGFYVEKYFREHPGATLADVYAERNRIKYRHIVMCPGYIVEKWAKTLSNEVPFAKVQILDEFKQLLELRKHGSEREGREFWVVSKDYAKMNYMSKPAPVKIGYQRKYYSKICNSCEKEFDTPGKYCLECGGIGFHKGELLGTKTGLICPECNELLFNYKAMGDSEHAVPLMPEDFAEQTGRNTNCFYCESMLWQPFVKNINDDWFAEDKKSKWYRATHYANKTQKSVKSIWVLRKHEHRYFAKVEEDPLKLKPDMVGLRKYSPATFIKRYMKGFFDFAVFDECHTYKGGATGQGNAMDALIKSSKRQLGLTGTIAGGKAEDLFYLMYRMDPVKMLRKGFQWSDVMKFSETYGTLERSYLMEEEDNETSKVMCRGKQLGSVRTKPGISPRVFIDIMLDCCVFLDISDMSNNLPPLKEMVVTVPIIGHKNPVISKMYDSYQRMIDCLNKASKTRGGRGLLGKMLQYSLSFLDKPFGEKFIINPATGRQVAEIEQFPQLWEDGLLPKEAELLIIIKKEAKEGRKCVVFAEFTSSPLTCVTGRLKRIIEDLGLKVAILNAASPEPLKREAWIHEQAEIYDVDVIITNPKCVETGIDFCWEKNGVYYNFPTLIFYQLGYSLYTVWQASHRHYRLNQREECRTYYLAYALTIQEVVIRLIAEKQVATSAIQGKFSVEGLSAMARGVDDRLIMAKALVDNDFSYSDDLQNMFDVLSVNSDEKDSTVYEPMKTLIELIGDGVLQQLDDFDRDPDIEELLADLFGEDDVAETKEVFISNSATDMSRLISSAPVNLNGFNGGMDNEDFLNDFLGDDIQLELITKNAVSQTCHRKQDSQTDIFSLF